MKTLSETKAEVRAYLEAHMREHWNEYDENYCAASMALQACLAVLEHKDVPEWLYELAREVRDQY